MPRRLFAAFLVSLLVTAGGPASGLAVDGGTLPLDVPSNAAEGRTVAFEFKLPKRVAAVDGRIIVDPAAAEVVGIAPLSGGQVLRPQPMADGYAFGAYGLKPTGGHTVIRVVLAPLTEGQLEFRVAIDSAADAKGKRVSVPNVRGLGRMRVSGGSKILPAPPLRGAPAPTRSAGKTRDIQQDGKIAVSDLTIMRAGWEHARLNDAVCGAAADATMDANRDGCVDVIDVQAVLAAQGRLTGDPVAQAASRPVASLGGPMDTRSDADLAPPLTMVVTSPLDTPDVTPGDRLCADALGQCTLRAALTESNWNSGADRIEFNLPGPAPVRIQLSNTVMPIMNNGNLTIDGYTQPGSQPNTLEHGTNAIPGVEIRGLGNSPRTYALRITSANNTVRGILFNNIYRAIVLDFPTATNNRILGNWVGYNANGSPHSYRGDYLFLLQGGAHHNIIGTPNLADRNYSGNGRKGVELWGSGTDDNIIQNNVFCTAPSGSTAVCNVAVDLDHGPQRNLIGGTGPFDHNVSGRTSNNGIEMSHGYSPPPDERDASDAWQVNDNFIIGNWVGFLPNGNYDPNHRSAVNNPGNADNGNAINAYDGSNNNLIEGNWVSSVWDGIQTMSSNSTGTIIRNNIIGETPNGGAAPVGRWGIVARLNTRTHLVEGNIIKNVGMGGIGITQHDVRFVRLTKNIVMNTLGPAIFLAPDPGNPTLGANNLLAAPVIANATTFEANGTGITGATVEVYLADRPAGQSGLPIEYLGSTVVSGGTWNLAIDVDEGDRLTALQHTPNGNTSPVGINVEAGEGTLPDPPVADFDWAQEVDSLTVDFSDTSTGSPTSWSWNFGDGSTSTARNPSHTYAAADDYTVTLTASNAGGDDDSTQTVTVSAIVPPPSGSVATDAFARSVTDGWGSADLGGAYTLQGPAANFDVGGGVGTFLMPTAGANRSALLEDVSALDVDISFRVSADKVATGSPHYVYGVARLDGNNAYRPKIILNPNGTVSVHAGRVINNAESSVAPAVVVPGLTQAANSWIWVRAQVVGASPTTIRVKAWAEGSAEPAGWQFQATDTTAALQSAGGVGLRVYIGGGVSNAPVLFRFDDYEVLDVP